jgi:hypothetical protein
MYTLKEFYVHREEMFMLYYKNNGAHLATTISLIITLVKKENNEKTCSIHKRHLCTIFGSSTISFADRVARYSI